MPPPPEAVPRITMVSSFVIIDFRVGHSMAITGRSGFAGTEHRMSVKWAGQVRRRSIEGSYPGVRRKERSVDVWLVISVLGLIDSACDPVPGFIRIAAGECPALKALIGPTEVVAGVASLPVFV